MSQNSIILPTTGTLSGLSAVQAINNANNTIASLFSGATEPAVTVAYQFWADTTSGWLKQRNAANNAWINVYRLADGAGIPPGVALDFTGPTPPTGFLAVPVAPTTISRATYADLFAVIGTAWGYGDGSTTFNMPYCPAGYTFIAGTTLGESSLGLVPAHNHGIVSVGTPGSGGGTGVCAISNGSALGTITTYISSYGSGSANLAAGIKSNKIIKY